jgi:polyvinyl alcohol dehydrogenase (cytochrome)
MASLAKRLTVFAGILVGVGALASGAQAAPCGGAPWPLVGANPANTRSAPGGPTPAQVPTLKVKWRFAVTDGDFTGTPVVADCAVFVGSNGGWVRALEETTGKVLWATKLSAPIPSSLAVAGGRVYAAGANPGAPFVAALSEATGKLLWQTTIDIQPDSDAYGSPLVADGSAYEGVAGEVTQEVGSSTIAVRGGLVALDAATGAIRWHTYTVPPGDDGGAVWSTPSLDPRAGVLYVGDGNAYHAPAAPTTDSVLAFDAATGAILDHFQATSGDVFGASTLTGPDYDFGASPNLIRLPNGTKAVGIGQKSGRYWMLTRSGLTPIWDTQVGPGSAFGGVVGSTAIGGGEVYGPNTVPGYSWALSESSGQLAWIDPGLDALHYGPASYSNGVVYTEDSLGFLDCVAAATGLPLARIELNPASSSSYAEAYGGVSIANGMVFADTGSQSTNGEVVALAPAGLP